MKKKRDKTKLRARHIMMSDEDVDKAKRKAEPHLATKTGNQRYSLSEALRYHVDEAPEPNI